MRQHVNPLSNVYKDIEPIPPLKKIYGDLNKPLHLDIGCGSGSFLINLAIKNQNWNYLGIEIREKLVIKSKSRISEEGINNLFFAFGNADSIIGHYLNSFPKDLLFSVSFNFPDPWFKKKHIKRRVIQPELISKISQILRLGGFLTIKSDVLELFKYMELTILESSSFIQYKYQDNELINTYNPTNLKTNREKYVIQKKLKVYESVYKKI